MDNTASERVRALLKQFADRHWPVLQRLAACRAGQEPIEVYRPVDFASVALAPAGELETWGFVLASCQNGGPIVVRSTGAAVLVLPIGNEWTLVADCPIGARFAVVATLMAKLATELRLGGDVSGE